MQCTIAKWRFMKEQDSRGLLSQLGVRTPWSRYHEWVKFCYGSIKNKCSFNKFLLAWDKFMPEIHLRQPGFTGSAYGAFTKNKEKIQKFEETGD